ncbi:MAG: anti-sigma factor [Acidobacteriota bacterium]
MLVQRTTEGLDPALERELTELLTRCPELDPESFELAAAAIEMTAVDTNEPLPATLRQRVLRQADTFFADAAAAEDSTPVRDTVVPFERPATAAPAGDTPSSSSVTPWLGWLVAAAVALAAFTLWPRAEQISTIEARQTAPTEPTPAQPTIAEQRATLIAAAADLLSIDWSSTQDPAAVEASGQVVWSTELQRGFMTFRGLPVNDPTVEQYQLWIFDTEQDAKYPVDGGVFDITAAGEVIVEIDPKLRIQEPTLFAVTIEKPGGVVVSSRERLPLLAQVG